MEDAEGHLILRGASGDVPSTPSPGPGRFHHGGDARAMMSN